MQVNCRDDNKRQLIVVNTSFINFSLPCKRSFKKSIHLSKRLITVQILYFIITILLTYKLDAKVDEKFTHDVLCGM